MIAVDDLDFVETNLISHDDKFIREFVQFLDTLVLRKRNLVAFSHPEVNTIHEGNVPFFYVAQAMNACGIEIVDSKTEVTCEDIWLLFDRIWNYWPGWFDPEIWVSITFQEFEEIFNFLPVGKVMSQKDLWWRWMMLQAVGRRIDSPLWEWTRENIYALPGFEQDPLKKKANLLITFLRYRPENFIDFEPDPMIDYHIMRIFLRMGLLQIPDYNAEMAIENEYLIRCYCYYIMQALSTYSKYDLSTINFFFWALGKTVCMYVQHTCLKSGVCPLESICPQLILRREPRIETINY